MGEYLNRDTSDPLFVPSGGGMTAEQAKAFAALAGLTAGVQTADPKLAMAKTIAAQTGKTVEEVLAFMGNSVVPNTADTPVQSVPVVEEITQPVPVPKEVSPDGFVVTEEVDPEQATQAELDQVFPDEEENNWDGKIREGSKVRVTYAAPGSKIKWAGKVGIVTRVIGNEKAKVYEVSFKGQKIAKVRLNKKTGKLERGYENKKLVTTFDQEDIELYS